MSIVKRVSVNLSNAKDVDGGITVREALKLITDPVYYDELFDMFNVKEYLDDFISINGAAEVVKSLIRVDEEFKKFDLKIPFKDVKVVKFTDEKQAVLEFSNIEDMEILNITKSNLITAQTKYSVRSDYFNELYSIDKYLDFCLTSEYDDIVQMNIQMLEEKNKENTKQKKFRLLKSNDGIYFARALTSAEVYKDYNIRFSLFIALIELHKLIKFKQHTYSVASYSFNESDAKIVFKRGESFNFIDKTKIGFALELINDEIKREAVKFNGIFSIYLGNGKEVFLRPDEVKAQIISFPHSNGIDKVKSKLENFAEKIDTFIKGMIEDTEKIKKIKDPNTIREFLFYKIDNSRTPELTSLYKADIKKMLSNNVSTIFQLFDIFNKIDLLINEEHIVAKDFWRYKLYQALLEGGKEKQ